MCPAPGQDAFAHVDILDVHLEGGQQDLCIIEAIRLDMHPTLTIAPHVAAMAI
jgi:hypothetical protein